MSYAKEKYSILNIIFVIYGCKYTCTQNKENNTPVIVLNTPMPYHLIINIYFHQGSFWVLPLQKYTLICICFCSDPTFLFWNFEFLYIILQLQFGSVKTNEDVMPRNAFRITSPLKGDSTDYFHKGPVMVMLSLLQACTSCWLNSRIVPDFRRHNRFW